VERLGGVLVELELLGDLGQLGEVHAPVVLGALDDRLEAGADLGLEQVGRSHG
jgi:hypothetical protein